MAVVVRQNGGLGNQLFEYAAGLFFTKKYGEGLEIVREAAEKAVCYGHPRPCMLSEFKITAPVRERSAWDRIMCSDSPSKRLVAAAARNAVHGDYYREHFSKTWVFQPNIPVADTTRLLYIHGCFQAYQYADAVEDQLREEFVVRAEPDAENRAMLKQIEACESPVSVHIRRGDYVHLYGGRDVLPLAYTKNAIEKISENVANPTFFIFSDDMPYAREHFSGKERIVFVDHNDELHAPDDLRLMAACRHHIIANSTFSWWGAWLNPDPNKVVVAPDVWRDPKVPFPDLLPPSWKIAKSEAILNYADLAP